MTLAALVPDVNQQYATAHAAHYTAKDLREAIELYYGIILAHPVSPEAAHSRTQLLRIANTAMALALVGDGQGRAHDAAPVTEAA